MDSLPKRRKYKDNPYTIKLIDNKYFICFKDSNNKIRIIEVNKEIYNVEHNLDTFKNTSDIIIANRFDDELENVKQKVYTRDLFRNN